MKKVLVGIAALTTILSIYFSYDVLRDIIIFIIHDPVWIFLLLIAVIIQIVGHVFRAKRTKLILDQAAESSLKFQFGALATGYLFDALLPFRLGELVRALLVARRLRISFLYTLASVAIERSTDVIFLSILVMAIALCVGGMLAVEFLVAAAIATLVAALILIFLLLLKGENSLLLGYIAKTARLFNGSINNSLRFKIWSLIFGLQNFFSQRKLVHRYVLYAVISWACYFISALVIVIPLLSITGINALIASVAPYVVSLSVPSPLDISSYHQLSLDISSIQLALYAKIIWALLVLPMAFIGSVTLVLYKVTREKTIKIKDDSGRYVNKLLRHQDISQELPGFLDSYFSGNELARILHKLEIAGRLSLVRFFKGGSDAITILVLADDKLIVKKIIPLQHIDRLKAQYDWLETHKEMSHLVRVLGEQRADDYYAIDLAYDPKNIPFFDYIHHNSLSQSTEIVDRVWKALYDHLYKTASPLKYHPKRRDQFVSKHLFGCIDKAAETGDVLNNALAGKTILINGKRYDNFYAIMEKIKAHPQAWRDIATYQESKAVHGDMAVDNILVAPDTKRPLIIDPAPDGNIINGPVFDMGKMMQSFYCGYEFSFRDDEDVVLSADNSINYRDNRSERYARLCRHVQRNLAKEYLSESEQRSLIFHAAVLHIRVLKHRVYINPHNVLKFYAIGVKTLNEFLAQYE